MKNIQIQKIIEQLEIAKDIAKEKWQIFADNSFIKSLRLDKPLTTLLMLWPALWGYFYVSGGFLNFIKLIFLMVFLRISCCLYDDISNPKIEVTGDRRQMATPSMWLLLASIILSGVISSQIYPGVLFLVLTWFVLVAIYPYLFKMIWWPQIYGGIIFGLWPALIGVTAGGEISFSSILICFAAFFWVVSLETVKAGVYKTIDMENSLKSVALWMGNKSISFIVACFSLTFIFLILAGVAANSNGFYYACLMLAQAVLMKNYYNQQQIEQQETKIHLSKIWVSVIVAVGILLG